MSLHPCQACGHLTVRLSGCPACDGARKPSVKGAKPRGRPKTIHPAPRPIPKYGVEWLRHAGHRWMAMEDGSFSCRLRGSRGRYASFPSLEAFYWEAIKRGKAV